ncbi:hypothetical protein DQ04_11581010 [Trypanosoma grayi]|uniref:hypothetical protein n=1 Tax=Trypanosoma grayi TaxID=71804 RepID=UPI0004F4014D|nr:hypothetical protein DQ04_11581010 [Trypanosoma grayi]KEG06937.1 hypothetical protein DQ04_11581010 [Trypanosoma grayi]
MRFHEGKGTPTTRKRRTPLNDTPVYVTLANSACPACGPPIPHQTRDYKAPQGQTWIQAGHREVEPTSTVRRDEPALDTLPWPHESPMPPCYGGGQYGEAMRHNNLSSTPFLQRECFVLNALPRWNGCLPRRIRRNPFPSNLRS